MNTLDKSSAFPVNTVKFLILAGIIYLAITGGVRALSANAPSANDLCQRIRPGMSVEEIEAATSGVQRWYLLRYDGTLVISARPHYSNSAVCRVAIDLKTKRSKGWSIGPLQQGDWPTL